jgi:hypothetical protein
MSIDSSIISLVSILASLLVAVVALLKDWVIDKSKWNRERKSAELERINMSATEFLTLLDMFRWQNRTEIEQIARKDYLAVYNDLQKSFYTWDNAVRSYLHVQELGEIEDIHNKLINLVPNEITPEVKDLINKVWGITEDARGRI